MTDLEVVKACALEMGYTVVSEGAELLMVRDALGIEFSYWPLENDAQCFALLKKFPHLCLPAITHAMFESCNDIGPQAKPIDFNRVICACVARMQGGKGE